MEYVNMLEAHVEQLTEKVAAEIQRSADLSWYALLNGRDLKQRIRESLTGALERFCAWMENEDDEDVLCFFREFGVARRAEGVPVRELVRAFLLIRTALQDRLDSKEFEGCDLQQMGVLQRKLNVFYHSIIHYLILGYEQGYRLNDDDRDGKPQPAYLDPGYTTYRSLLQPA